MTFAYGPYTDDIGFKTTTSPDGSGGLNLTCDKYGSIHVTSAQLANTTTAELVRRVVDQEDFETNWRNLCEAIGLPDPGPGSPAV